MEGYLDPKEARPFDRTWWLKVQWTLDWLEHRNRNEVRSYKHELNCSLLDYATGAKAVELHWDQAHMLQELVHKSLLPWLRYDTSKMGRAEFQQLMDLYIHKWGDWRTDPKAKAEMERTVAHLQEMAGMGQE